MKKIKLTIDSREVTTPGNFTILEAIQKAGIYVPTLCHDPELKPYGACRLCIVKIKGMRGLPTACTTPAEDGMKVFTETEEIQRIRRGIVEMAIAGHPTDCLFCYKSQACELLKVSRYLGVEKTSVDRLRRDSISKLCDTSNPAFDFDPNKCILCGKCVRACHEIQGVGAIDFSFRGYHTRISPFGSRPFIQSSCQSCGECVDRCPTGALIPKQAILPQREVKTICPFCGVGCSIYIGLREGKIVRARGAKESPVNRGGLCVKGRYGLDFVSHPDRIIYPMVRYDGVPKTIGAKDMSQVFRKAEWDEVLKRFSLELSKIQKENGPDSIGVLSSAKCTNEDNYIIQKFARAVLGTNNVDHCARLCHSSTVAAALSAFGDGAMSNSISDIDAAKVMLVIGSNTTECHPIIGRRIKRNVKFKGARLIVADPRAIELTETAEVHLSHKPGTDVALLNGIMHQIVKEGLYDKTFVKNRCEEFGPFLDSLSRYDLESVETITGVSKENVRKSAMIFGKAKRAIVFYGMGITQHTTGTDNVKAIANLLMLTGNMGRKGTGFSPLRGQNNVQGACDMGALPNVFPGYQKVNNPTVNAKFSKAWGKRLDEKPGLTLTDMLHAAHKGKLRAMYVVGENPLMSEPDLHYAREAMARLQFLAVQDLFLTETAQLADVVLPAAGFAEKDGTFTSTERRVQLIRKAIDPPGKARPDWEIVSDLSSLFGYPMKYSSSAEIMSEISELTPIYGGISHDRLNNNNGLQWPCWTHSHAGTATLHKEQFTRGKGQFHVVHDKPPAEYPSNDYPLLLTTGRVLEHWHTGSMSHRSHVLESLVSESNIEINPTDADHLGIIDGDIITVSSRRGKIQTKVRKTRRVQEGLAFMAFHWSDAPANLLTNSAVDPLSKIPEYKVSSVNAMLTVLESAAMNNAFLMAFIKDPLKALEVIHLTTDQKKALFAGDISMIENQVGALEERLKAWIISRLAQEMR